MNKLSALALAAAFAASTPFVALAQQTDATVDAGADVGVEVDAGDTEMDAGVDAGAGAEADATDAAADADVGAEANAEAAAAIDAEGSAETQYSYANLRAAIEAGFDVEALNPETTIHIVAVSELDAGDGEFTYDEMVAGESAFAGGISAIQTALEGNAEVQTALEAEGYALEDVLGIWTAEDASVVIFVDDMAD